MSTRRIVSMLIAVAESLVVLAPLHGVARLDVDGLDPLPVEGGPADRRLRRHAADCGTLDAVGRLRLTGVLDGTVTQRSRARIRATQQPFSALATLRDPGQTTDVVLLALAPVALDSTGLRIKLAPIAVEIETLPPVGEELAMRLSTP